MVTSYPDGITKTAAAGPITVTGLTNGQSYELRVKAKNNSGWGALSTPSNKVTPNVTVPGPPTAVRAVGGDGQAKVSFSPPAFNGGSPITSFTVTSSPGNMTASGASSPLIVKGLTNGTVYTFTVTAGNAVGTGPASNPSNSVTPFASVITLTSPNGAEQWMAGSSYSITWNYTGKPGRRVKIELLRAETVINTLTSPTTGIGTAGKGTFLWSVPQDQASGDNYKIKVSSTSSDAYTDTSDAQFTIIGPKITVTSPKRGDSWICGQKQTIRWTYLGKPGSKVKINLLKGNVLVKTLAASRGIGTAGSGSYACTLPGGLSPGCNYRIQIISTTYSTCSAKSVPFCITCTAAQSSAGPD